MRYTKANIFLVGVVCIAIIFLLYREYRPAQFGYAKTSSGYVSFEELEANVFRPNNFKIIESSHLVPKLDFVKRPSCAQVFDDWLRIAVVNNQSKTPPDTLPLKQEKEFLLNGYTNLIKVYKDDRANPEPRQWKQIPSWLKMNESDLSQISNYGRYGKAVYHALGQYPISGQSGFILGSETPWIEVYALMLGAHKLLTVEYQNTTIHGTHKVKYVHPIDFARQWQKHQNGFDFAISFSSIEHSGLGRYGDPIDPIGDLREVWKTSCLLKRGGIFFLGLPRGEDTLVYNLHRIYGAIRLAMITTGFEWLATFYDDTPNPYNLTHCDLEYTGPNLKQDLYVLRKL